MTNQTPGYGPQQQPKQPIYGPGAKNAQQFTKNPFSTLELFGQGVAILGVIGIIIGFIISLDDGATGAAAIVGSISFATMGLILVGVARIGTGLRNAGYLK